VPQVCPQIALKYAEDTSEEYGYTGSFWAAVASAFIMYGGPTAIALPYPGDRARRRQKKRIAVWPGQHYPSEFGLDGIRYLRLDPKARIFAQLVPVAWRRAHLLCAESRVAEGVRSWTPRSWWNNVLIFEVERGSLFAASDRR
jgi:hypothetical protein